MNAKERYLAHYPYERNVFVMLRYADDRYHERVEHNIREAFKKTHYFNPVIAKDLTPEYFPTLSSAITNSIAMCRMGIAVFSYNSAGHINPNIAFELGIMWEQRKDILILKDDRVRDLFTDISGIIWKPFSGDIERLRTRPNDLSEHVVDWLTWQQHAVDDVFGFSYLANVEQFIDIDPVLATRNLQSEIERCLSRIAEYSRLNLQAYPSLIDKVRHLYEQRQVTQFFAKILVKMILLCERYGGTGHLPKSARDRIIGYARVSRDIYNDWFRTFRTWRDLEQFLALKR